MECECIMNDLCLGLLSLALDLVDLVLRDDGKSVGVVTMSVLSVCSRRVVAWNEIGR